mmetsp:Transcript_5519/g.13312  ORF Transcript_5519/g.13312 Transcript_5519/m.13312 type:complete len:292 (+) Transcript_5519:5571-6446(+)
MRAGFLHPVDLPGRPAQRGHRQRQHPVRTVLQHHHAGAEWGIRQSAVAGRGGLRHHRRLGGHPGRERLPQLPGATTAAGGGLACDDARTAWPGHRPGAGLDPAPAHDLHERAAGGQLHPVLDLHHHCGLLPAVPDDGGRGPDLWPHGPHLWLCAGRRLAGHLHGDAGAGGLSAAAPGGRGGNPAGALDPARLRTRAALVPRPCPLDVRLRGGLLDRHRRADQPTRQRVSAGARGGQSVDPGVHAAHHLARGRHPDGQPDAQDHPGLPRGVDRGVAARPARRRQRCLGLQQR